MRCYSQYLPSHTPPLATHSHAGVVHPVRRQEPAVHVSPDGQPPQFTATPQPLEAAPQEPAGQAFVYGMHAESVTPTGTF